MKLLPLLALVAFMAPVPEIRAALLFDDKFDGPPYSDNAPFVTGSGQIAHGIWGSNHGGSGAAITSTAQAFSGTRSLALTTGADTPATDRSQVTARFSADGITAEERTEGFVLRFAFLKDGTGYTPQFYISGTDGHSALIYMGNSMTVYHGTTATNFGTLAANTWYQVEVVMPTIPPSDNPEAPEPLYTVTLFNAAGQTINSSTGSLRGPATSYSFFTFYHTNTVDRTFYVDNVTVTAVPEPATTALLLLAGAGLLRYRARR